jgi:hypothetical protein
MEALLLALWLVAAQGGLAQSGSPLARAVFGTAPTVASVVAHPQGAALALFAVLLVVASVVAAAGPWLCRRYQGAERRHLALALGAAAALGLTLVLLPTLPSGDIFSYILYGRISAVHHANPLVAPPSAFPHDPFLGLVYWSGTRSVYGPAWLLLSGGVTLLAQALGGSLATYVLLYKLLGLGAHLANAALIWAILGRIAPERRLLGTLLYAWNPLCLLEFCTSGHNDALMLSFMLLGVYCLVRGWEWPALLCFGVSIAIKYVLLALLPLYLLVVARQRASAGRPYDNVAGRQRASAGRPYEEGGMGRGEVIRVAAWAAVWRGLVVAGVVVGLTLPFWAGAETLGAIFYSPPAQQLDNSLLEVAQWPLRAVAQVLGIGPHAAARGVQTGLKVAGLLVFVGLWLRALWRARDLESMLDGWGWVLFWYAVVASVWFWPWYVTWGVAVVALLAWGELTVATLLLAGGVTTLYAFLPLYASGIYGYRSLLAFGPALGYLGYVWYRRRADAGKGAGKDALA